MERIGITKLLCVVVGMWIAVTVSMGFVATGNFKVVGPEDLRDSAEIYEDIPGPEEDGERYMALRYIASELNRFFFAQYDKASLALGGASLLLLLMAGRRRGLELGIVLLGLAIAAISYFYTTPLMTDLGREIDFLPRNPEKPAKVEEFYQYHTIIIVAELAKVVLLGLLTLSLLRGRRSE
ncbi:MAG: hypothetical protein RL885_29870 [Planctomycetota bacterium]